MRKTEVSIKMFHVQDLSGVDQREKEVILL
jgi:hypothetical protein